MYEDLFIINFFGNFLISFLFLIICVFSSYSISNFLNQKKIFIFNEFQPIIIFYIIFLIYSLLFNILIIFNLYNLFNISFYILLFIQILFLILNFNGLKNYEFKTHEYIRSKIYIFSFFFLLFLISILPITDADSISLHQNLANKIFIEGLNNVNLQKNISFTIFSNTQNLLIFSPILKSDNFGSQLNIITLCFFIFLNFKNHKNFIYILFSSPLIIYFISTQKLQLFFSILFLIIFIIINKGYLKTKFELFLSLLLLAFYASGNLSYILFAMPLYLFFLSTQKGNWFNIIFYSIISFLIILVPIFIIKQIYFQNFLAPFLDEILGMNNVLYNAYALSIRSTSGWLGNIQNLDLYLKPFISLSINEFSSSLGIIFLLMLVNIKLLKKTKYFPLIIIAIVISTGQILPRYYFESFLILAYYFDIKNLLSKIIIVSHNLLMILISIGFIYYAYIDSNIFFTKSEYMNKFSYTYYNSQEIKKLKIEENILDLSASRPSLFYPKNVYSSRTLNFINSFYDRNEYLKNFISDNSIKYLIKDKNVNLPSCLSIVKINDINQRIAVRNFLRNEKIKISEVFKINSNNC